MPTVMDARIALHVLRAWARERVENREPFEVVTDIGLESWSPCDTKGENGWQQASNGWSSDRSDAKAEALAAVEKSIAVIVKV